MHDVAGCCYPLPNARSVSKLDSGVENVECWKDGVEAGIVHAVQMFINDVVQ